MGIIDILCCFDWASPIIDIVNPGDPVFLGNKEQAYIEAEKLKKQGYLVKVDGLPDGNHWVEIKGKKGRK